MRRRGRRPQLPAGDRPRGARRPFGAGELEARTIEHAAPRLHGVDDRVADRTVEHPVAESHPLGERVGEPWQLRQRAGRDRDAVRVVRAAVGIHLGDERGGLVGQAGAHLRPREAVAAPGRERVPRAVHDRARPSSARAVVAGGRGGWADRVRPHLPPPAGRGDGGETRRCPADGDQRFGSIGARPQDDGDEVTAEAALRRQEHRLAERRGDGRVERVPALAQAGRAGERGERCGRAHDAVAPAAGALLGHHRGRGRRCAMTRSLSLPVACRGWSGAHRGRARSGCARRSILLVDRARRRTIVARPGRGKRVPSSAMPVDVHPVATTAISPSDDNTTCASSTRNLKSSIAGQVGSHCSRST